MRSVKPYVSFHILKIIYDSNFHLVVTYSLFSWGHYSDSIRIFRLQKRIVRMMMGCRRDDSCTKLFPFFEILPLPSQYIFSLLLFVIKNMKNFTVKSEIQKIETRQYKNLHQPTVNLTKYQKGVYCIGIKVYNALPSYIKI
jgi:hypothetical protein